MNADRLYIVTVLPPTGETGVQTHFRTFCDITKLTALKHIHIVSPYAANKVVRGLLFRIAKLAGYWDIGLQDLYHRQFFYLLLYEQLYSALRNRDTPAIIYAQDPVSAKAALNLKRKGYRAEIVLAIHFNISEAWELAIKGTLREGGRLWREILQLEQEVISGVDRLIFVSRFTEKAVLERIPTAARVPRWVIPNAVSDLPKSADCGIAGDLITIGTLEPRKNQGFLIRVLAAAHRLGHRYRLTIVGDGECKNEIIELASMLGVQEYVTFTGYVPNARRLIWFHRAYVHAALMESCPIVILEALTDSKPIFAAPVGGIPEVFEDGVEGVYWNLDDPEVAARVVIKVLEDKNVYEQMSNAARRRYEKQFRTDVVAEAWLQAVLATSGRDNGVQILSNEPFGRIVGPGLGPIVW
jgi:glycosyltransferase involved in cell wall biosynthesis